MSRQARVTLMRRARAIALAMATATWPALAQEDASKLAGPGPLKTVQDLIGVLTSRCPLAAPSDQKAFDVCRSALFQSTAFQDLFSGRLLWGAPKIDVPIWKLPLTAFDRRVFTGLYLPLYMFNGDYHLERKNDQAWVILHLRAAFRNRLAPGQYPYPFWHKPEKWQAYEATNELVLYIDPATNQVWYVLRANDPELPPLTASHEAVVPPVFDGKWMWTDADGKTQPAVTLFDGLLSSGNPYSDQLQASYKNFAGALREQACTSCHNPQNPQGMSPLVLMQTPAHALGEVGRMLRMVESGRMPIEEWGAPKPLAAEAKAQFLLLARAFSQAADQALDWEKTKTNTAQ